ncbi:MAG TPA: Uma2 family endonuclease [Polyangiaceae bacterium]|nr:Uma2 family endonuclease [Polyangiaceae bacterium]
MQPHDTVRTNPDASVLVQHRVHGFSDSWVIVEQPVPEAAWHDHAIELLRALLSHWVAGTGRDAVVFRNLAIRLRSDRPQIGFDPDIMLVAPAPPGASELSSLRLWVPEHRVPSLVIEVVSPGHPYKDYVETPDKCAALGVHELVVFDPLLVGPKVEGVARRLQLWRRTDSGAFERVASGEAPAFSETLGAYFVPTERGRRLRIAEDAAGQRPWLTGEEAQREIARVERAAKEAERAAREQERAAREQERAVWEREKAETEFERAEKERVLARVAELEAELRKRSTE